MCLLYCEPRESLTPAHQLDFQGPFRRVDGDCGSNGKSNFQAASVARGPHEDIWGLFAIKWALHGDETHLTCLFSAIPASSVLHRMVAI